MDEIAAVQRKLRNFLCGDDLAEGGIGGFDGDGGSGNFDLCGDGAGNEGEIELAGFVNLKAEILGFDGLKTFVLDAEGVDGNGKQRDEVVADVIGCCVANDAGALRSGGDGGAGNGGAGFVENRAGEAAVGLTEEGGRNAKRKRNECEQKTDSKLHEQHPFRRSIVTTIAI